MWLSCPSVSPSATRYNVGHFFLAIDPRAFRDGNQFEEDLDDMIDALHATKRADENQSVLVAGDLEQAQLAERSRNGIPVPAARNTIRQIAQASSAPYLLDESTI